MRHSASNNFDPARRKTFIILLLAFSAPPICAIVGLILARAFGYSPF